MKLNKLNVVLLCSWQVFVTLFIIHLLMDNRDLRQKVNHSRYMVNKLSTNVEMVRQKQLYHIKAFENFVDLTSKEFEETWVSFSRIRDNFKVIGYTLEYGSHLKEDDKMTKEEMNKPKLTKPLDE